ncbi:hypothetical protein C8F01DRAFT_1101755 [Mycena amicta]|nr:hypothetical protein C8F01DRAFT_1101755 [Mycena amicta]
MRRTLIDMLLGINSLVSSLGVQACRGCSSVYASFSWKMYPAVPSDTVYIWIRDTSLVSVKHWRTLSTTGIHCPTVASFRHMPFGSRE